MDTIRDTKVSLRVGNAPCPGTLDPLRPVPDVRTDSIDPDAKIRQPGPKALEMGNHLDLVSQSECLRIASSSQGMEQENITHLRTQDIRSHRLERSRGRVITGRPERLKEILTSIAADFRTSPRRRKIGITYATSS